MREDGAGSYGGHDDGEDNDFPQIAAVAPSLREHLLWQVNLLQLPDRDKQLVSLLVETLDDDGYLTQELDEIAAMFPAEMELDREDLQIALQAPAAPRAGRDRRAQPRGVPGPAARDPAGRHAVAQRSAGHRARPSGPARLARLCQAEEAAQVQRRGAARRAAAHHRASTRGRAANFSNDEARYIVPDVVVRKVKGMWRASLNPDAMPKLRINRMYADILHRNRDASLQQLAGQLQEAKWLIKNVQQRFDTILRVSQAIVDRQRHFFEHGEVAMRPLVLREIADTLGLHESTVSRVTTQKFMLTPRGIFELKYFFGSHVTTETGGACSATAIRALIKQLVAEEDSRKPLSDSQISEILGKQGIVVARRTIAKYRESLQILPVNLRKSI